MQSGNSDSPSDSALRAPTPVETGLSEILAGDGLDGAQRHAKRALRIPSDPVAHVSDVTSPQIELPPLEDPTTVVPTLLPDTAHAAPPVPAPTASPVASAPPEAPDVSMRVVRRRIRKVGGSENHIPTEPIAPEPSRRSLTPIASEPPRVSIFPAPEPISALAQPPSPQIEVSIAEDFEVPPIDDEPTTEIATVTAAAKPKSVPPPPPAAAPRPTAIPTPAAPAISPAPEAPSRSMMRTVPDLQAPQVPVEPAVFVPPGMSPPPMVAEPTSASATGAAHVHPHPHGGTEDESVEISLEDAAELLSDGRRNSDPSLALLDALAELPPDAPVPEEPKSQNKTAPPPPPEAVARAPKAGPSAPVPPPTGVPAINPRATAVTVPDRNKRRKLWWEELFGDDYLRTMEKSSPAQTQSEADWIEQALGVEAGASILDVACGTGRQASALGKRGYEVVGLDYSLAMLTRAAEVSQEQGERVTFMQADMTNMEFSEVFDAAYCVGTSFGYFDDEKNAEVARKIHRALKPHGTFLLSVVNRDHVIQRQPGMAWFEGDGCVCMEETTFNFITSRLNVKRTVIFEDGRQRETEYSIRLYSLHELGQVLHAAGFRILEVSGNARTPSAFFGPSSRELIILAQKRGPEVVEIAGLATAPYDAQTEPPKN